MPLPKATAWGHRMRSRHAARHHLAGDSWTADPAEGSEAACNRVAGLRRAGGPTGAATALVTASRAICTTGVGYTPSRSSSVALIAMSECAIGTLDGVGIPVERGRMNIADTAAR
jgi:hypothetical protein